MFFVPRSAWWVAGAVPSTCVLYLPHDKRYFPSLASPPFRSSPFPHYFFPKGGLLRSWFCTLTQWTVSRERELHCMNVPSQGVTGAGTLWFPNALSDQLSRSCREGTGTFREGTGTEIDFYSHFKYQIPWFSDWFSIMLERTLSLFLLFSAVPYLILPVNYR